VYDWCRVVDELNVILIPREPADFVEAVLVFV